jgi:hypothetical protein
MRVALAQKLKILPEEIRCDLTEESAIPLMNAEIVPVQQLKVEFMAQEWNEDVCIIVSLNGQDCPS